jgi:hypothetical protein
MDHLEDSPCLALRLDLRSGDFFRSQVRYKFSTSICPPPHNHGFSLVISFGRANFFLNIHNMGLALSACLFQGYWVHDLSPEIIHLQWWSELEKRRTDQVQGTKSRVDCCSTQIFKNAWPSACRYLSQSTY